MGVTGLLHSTLLMSSELGRRLLVFGLWSLAFVLINSKRSATNTKDLRPKTKDLSPAGHLDCFPRHDHAPALPVHGDAVDALSRVDQDPLNLLRR